MSGLGHAIGLAWIIAAAWFLLSVVSAPLFLLVSKARARGKRLFRDLPNERLNGMHPDPHNRTDLL